MSWPRRRSARPPDPQASCYNFLTQKREVHAMRTAAPGRLGAVFAFLWTASALVSAATETRTGTVQILTADDFDSGTSERIVTLVSSRGVPTVLELPAGAQPLD